MKAYIGITDYQWYKKLSSIPDIDEVNFWQPSGEQYFRALSTGEPFLFKLHSPHSAIVGGGFFAYNNILPLSLAWDAFKEKNGVNSLGEMRERLEKYRRQQSIVGDYKIGCILLAQPFFFNKEDWIPEPSDWNKNIVRGKGYDITAGIGKEIWDQVQIHLAAQVNTLGGSRYVAEEVQYGEPTLVRPRLGQGTFRIMVTDIYRRRCAITQERTLPALEASHIKPVSDSGPHRINNGILFRADIHRLFDQGYATITPDHKFEVSRRVREEFENGRDYYILHGKSLYLPANVNERPDKEYITWHNEKIFKG